MRRITAVLLLVLFLAQSSGSALAAPTVAGTPPVFDVHAIVQSLQSLLAAVEFGFAQGAMAAPTIGFRPIDPGDPNTEISGLESSRIVPMIAHAGGIAIVLRPRTAPPLPGHLPLDRRALRASMSPTLGSGPMGRFTLRSDAPSALHASAPQTMRPLSILPAHPLVMQRTPLRASTALQARVARGGAFFRQVGARRPNALPTGYEIKSYGGIKGGPLTNIINAKAPPKLRMRNLVRVRH